MILFLIAGDWKKFSNPKALIFWTSLLSEIDI
jgi:threonine/homoserine/homoserine lactone efflux protein